MTKEQQIINEFMRDPHVRKYLSFGGDINVFSILCIGETRHSNMLGWLLNPRGSHLYGDYFLKALLYQAYTSVEKDKQFKSNVKEWSYHELEYGSFLNAIVSQECILDKSNRIDYIINDVDNDIEIFIENKIESRFNKGQLDRYLKSLSSRNSKARYRYYIFLHSYDSEAEKAKFPWIGLTYDWLVDAIRNRPFSAITNSSINYLINSYADWLDDSYTFQNTQDYEESAAAINARHGNFLKSLRNRVSGITDYTTHLDDEMILLYARHPDKFDFLFDFSSWEYLAKQIQTTLPEYTIDYGVGQNWLTLHNDEWYRHYINDEEFWMWVHIQEKVQPEGVKDNRKHYQITLNAAFEYLLDSDANKLRDAFSDTARVRQIAKYNFSTSKSDSLQKSQAMLLHEAIPIIRSIYNKVGEILA